jgi:hypothetical protein
MAKPEVKRSVSVKVERKTMVTIPYEETCRILAEAVGCPDPKNAIVDLNEYGDCHVHWTESEHAEEEGP